jgi:hypothetical protein
LAVDISGSKGQASCQVKSLERGLSEKGRCFGQQALVSGNTRLWVPYILVFDFGLDFFPITSECGEL